MSTHILIRLIAYASQKDRLCVCLVMVSGNTVSADRVASGQGFMQDENVACHDIGKLSFERAVGCFGTPQLERAARFPMPQLERVTCFAMPQLERTTRFPNVPSRVATRFRMFQFEHE